MVMVCWKVNAFAVRTFELASCGSTIWVWVWVGDFAFSSTLIRWSTCVAFMVPFMGLRVHCWYRSVSCRRVTTHVVLRAWIVILLDGEVLSIRRGSLG